MPAPGVFVDCCRVLYAMARRAPFRTLLSTSLPPLICYRHYFRHCPSFTNIHCHTVPPLPLSTATSQPITEQNALATPSSVRSHGHITHPLPANRSRWTCQNVQCPPHFHRYRKHEKPLPASQHNPHRSLEYRIRSPFNGPTPNIRNPRPTSYYGYYYRCPPSNDNGNHPTPRPSPYRNISTNPTAPNNRLVATLSSPCSRMQLMFLG